MSPKQTSRKITALLFMSCLSLPSETYKFYPVHFLIYFSYIGHRQSTISPHMPLIYFLHCFLYPIPTSQKNGTKNRLWMSKLGCYLVFSQFLSECLDPLWACSLCQHVVTYTLPHPGHRTGHWEYRDENSLLWGNVAIASSARGKYIKNYINNLFSHIKYHAQ